MSARALVNGALHKAAEGRTSKAGTRFSTFALREKVNGSTRWWSVVAFDEASIAAVLSMKVGEPIAVSGEFSAELWTPEGGEPRLSWQITADAILSAKAKPKQRTGREVAEASWAAP
jgi:single-stranded DNA-binding protein